MKMVRLQRYRRYQEPPIEMPHIMWCLKFGQSCARNCGHRSDIQCIGICFNVLETDIDVILVINQLNAQILVL